MERAVWRSMGSGVILSEDAGAIVGGEDEDGIDGEEGHVGRHYSAGEESEGKYFQQQKIMVAV